MPSPNVTVCSHRLHKSTKRSARLSSLRNDDQTLGGPSVNDDYPKVHTIHVSVSSTRASVYNFWLHIATERDTAFMGTSLDRAVMGMVEQYSNFRSTWIWGGGNDVEQRKSA